MKAKKSKMRLRREPQVRRTKMLFGNVPNPLRVDTKTASAGVDKMKMGAGIFVRVKFISERSKFIILYFPSQTSFQSF